jgi:hypothetical protein
VSPPPQPNAEWSLPARFARANRSYYRHFKHMARARISEFESSYPSHGVGLWEPRVWISGSQKWPPVAGCFSEAGRPGALFLGRRFGLTSQAPWNHLAIAVKVTMADAGRGLGARVRQ